MEKIGRYEIIKEIGKGGMGLVYLAHDPYLNCQVALKIISPDVVGSHYQAAFQRFLKEAQILAKLNHPNIVRIFDISPDSAKPHISMEYVEGTSLNEIIEDQLPITHLKKIDHIIKIVEGLSEIHKAGLIHRDLKPSNIMITHDGKIKIMDFGITKDLADTNKQTLTQEIIGSPSYMSPEQIKCKKIDNKADLFSLGSIIYEFVTGENPFIDETLAETLRNILTIDVSKLDHYKKLDTHLKKIIKNLLYQEPEKRYATCHHLLIDLKKYRAFLKANTHSTSRPFPVKSLILAFMFFLVCYFSYQHFSKEALQIRDTATINKNDKPIKHNNQLKCDFNSDGNVDQIEIDFCKSQENSSPTAPQTKVAAKYTSYFENLGICGDKTCNEIEKSCGEISCSECKSENESIESANTKCQAKVAELIKTYTQIHPNLICGDKKCNTLEKHCGICKEDCPPTNNNAQLPTICKFLFAGPTTFSISINSYMRSRKFYEDCAFKALEENSDKDKYIVNLFTCLQKNLTPHISQCLNEIMVDGKISTQEIEINRAIMCLLYGDIRK